MPALNLIGDHDFALEEFPVVLMRFPSASVVVELASLKFSLSALLVDKVMLRSNLSSRNERNRFIPRLWLMDLLQEVLEFSRLDNDVSPVAFLSVELVSAGGAE